MQPLKTTLLRINGQGRIAAPSVLPAKVLKEVAHRVGLQVGRDDARAAPAAAAQQQLGGQVALVDAGEAGQAVRLRQLADVPDQPLADAPPVDR